ncbi:MAG: radical SAM protein [Candidatus Heimdallarchaeota archaeon]|nr:radical SAM protein [Candidatus Heimdallarchaeota archaeon]
MMIALIDGYIDEPGCLGVPPYLSPLSRYLYGMLKSNHSDWIVNYLTIDQIRSHEHQTDSLEWMTAFNLLIFISGVAVPGKYLGGTPIKFSELQKYGSHFPSLPKVLCGPATNFGVGEEGGKPSKSVANLQDYFDLIITGDAEIVLNILLNEGLSSSESLWNLKDYFQAVKQERPNIESLQRQSMDEIRDFAVAGAEVIDQHPNFDETTGGNLICEIETFRGCPRHRSGGCSFCVEPTKGKTIHREINSIVAEVQALYEQGVRHFRLGNQTDFYAYQHGDYIHSRYPQPNPGAIEQLLQTIRTRCPQLRTLHIDNVNPLNFALYPEQAEKITKSITEYCSPGNIAAIGVESVDDCVITQNNLKANAEEILEAIRIINRYGREIGENGNPKFLPGLNFIMGLPGETEETLEQNSQFLQQLLEQDLWVRRINLRKLLVPSFFDQEATREVLKHLRKFSSNYFHWKKFVREEIDMPMLKKLYPIGRILKDVYAEVHDGKGTLLRQVGTYPITCFVPQKLSLHQFYSLVVVNHGYRSLTCLKAPVDFQRLSQSELVEIDGIGKKRAITIQVNQPKTKKDWLELIPDLWPIVKKIQPSKGN